MFKNLIISANTKNCLGNVYWDSRTGEGKDLAMKLFAKMKAAGWWCSCFPEGDGFCFDDKLALDSNVQLLTIGNWLAD